MKKTQTEIIQEKEADYFARCLLMPEKMVIKFLKGLDKAPIRYTAQDVVKEIAKKFQVEQIHAALRLNDLKLV